MGNANDMTTNYLLNLFIDREVKPRKSDMKSMLMNSDIDSDNNNVKTYTCSINKENKQTKLRQKVTQKIAPTHPSIKYKAQPSELRREQNG